MAIKHRLISNWYLIAKLIWRGIKKFTINEVIKMCPNKSRIHSPLMSKKVLTRKYDFEILGLQPEENEERRLSTFVEQVPVCKCATPLRHSEGALTIFCCFCSCFLLHHPCFILVSFNWYLWMWNHLVHKLYTERKRQGELARRYMVFTFRLSTLPKIRSHRISTRHDHYFTPNRKDIFNSLFDSTRKVFHVDISKQ